MSNRDNRAKIAQETLEILKLGYYQNKLREVVDISEVLETAKAGSIHYTPEMLQNGSCIFANQISQKTTFIVSNETTLNAASSLVNIEGIEKVLCLNFASAKNPGGGFLNGSQAQEESLARATGLYPCIVQMAAMYEANRFFGSSLYTDNMIYSPQVPVIRDDKDELLDKPFLASFLTVPAVNVGALKQKGNEDEVSKIEATMLLRTEKLLSIAVSHGYNFLILGAWGCGVFKNNPGDVARYFYHHLVKNSQLNHCFEKVVFAVLDNSKDEANIKEFQAVFGR